MLRSALIALFATTLALSGCAHSPQQLSLNPELNVDLVPVGQGQPVNVRVEDGRSSQTLGSRGGMYADTSLINVSSDQLVPKLQAQAEKGVRLLGFTPVSGRSDVPQITLTVVELKYQVPQGVYVTEANISATLKADVKNRQSYSGRYSASTNQRFAKAPSEETNTRLISEVLSDALGRAFQDNTLSQVLAQ